LEYRSETQRNHQAPSISESSGGWKKVREVSSFVNMVTVKRIRREREALDSNSKLQARPEYYLETNEANVQRI